MKKVITLGLIAGALGLSQVSADAQGVGWWDMKFNPGQNLFGVPVQGSSNVISTIFASMPAGTTVELWNSTAGAFVSSSTYTNGNWSSELTLDVGTGARLTLPGTENVTNTILGEVVTGDGQPTNPGDGIGDYIPPSTRTEAGVFLLSSITALDLPLDLSTPQGTTNTVWDWVVGRKPQSGESFISLDSASQTYSTNVFTGSGWNNGTPQLLVGQSAFFTLKQYVPEPSSVALFGLAGATLLWIRRRR